MTSSMPPPRRLLGLDSPIAQRIASKRLDLPQPLGPTTPVRPGSMRSSAGSTKLLNPLSFSRRMRNLWPSPGSPYPPAFRSSCCKLVQSQHRRLLAVDQEVRRARDARRRSPPGRSAAMRVCAASSVRQARPAPAGCHWPGASGMMPASSAIVSSDRSLSGIAFNCSCGTLSVRGGPHRLSRVELLGDREETRRPGAARQQGRAEVGRVQHHRPELPADLAGAHILADERLDRVSARNGGSAGRSANHIRRASPSRLGVAHDGIRRRSTRRRSCSSRAPAPVLAGARPSGIKATASEDGRRSAPRSVTAAPP